MKCEKSRPFRSRESRPSVPDEVFGRDTGVGEAQGRYKALFRPDADLTALGPSGRRSVALAPAFPEVVPLLLGR